MEPRSSLRPTIVDMVSVTSACGKAPFCYATDRTLRAIRIPKQVHVLADGLDNYVGADKEQRRRERDAMPTLTRLQQSFVASNFPATPYSNADLTTAGSAFCCGCYCSLKPICNVALCSSGLRRSVNPTNTTILIEAVPRMSIVSSSRKAARTRIAFC
ncbi:hypothetical protein IAQ61_011816 [Plenodomus lingam]|uniref:uncharacterized protein n=1 Tax=Leptosphaeria maculans TaxID=5022 RepID=UPI003331A303|nr:hypothetical protein IAQ61_011816 [Plenodomus lingam]